MSDYDEIAEIFPEDDARVDRRPPLAEWEVEVLERGLSVELGAIGGRESFVANARVRVTEEDGTTWTGLTVLG